VAEESAEPVRLRIRCRADGPYVVEGPVEIVDAAGNVFPLPTDKPKLALCRCGASKTKPFCDGTHKQIGWVGDEKCPDSPTTPPDATL
jgi:CDGSH-type Zn-finger protein